MRCCCRKLPSESTRVARQLALSARLSWPPRPPRAHRVGEEGLVDLRLHVAVVVHDDGLVAHVWATVAPVDEVGAQRGPEVRAGLVEGQLAALPLQHHPVLLWQRAGVPVVLERAIAEQRVEKDGDRGGQAVREPVAELLPAAHDGVALGCLASENGTVQLRVVMHPAPALLSMDGVLSGDQLHQLLQRRRVLARLVPLLVLRAPGGAPAAPRGSGTHGSI